MARSQDLYAAICAAAGNESLTDAEILKVTSMLEHTAELSDIPAFVSNLTDDEKMLIEIIRNSQNPHAVLSIAIRETLSRLPQLEPVL